MHLPWLTSSEASSLAEKRCRNRPALCRSTRAAAEKSCTGECRIERERAAGLTGEDGWTDRHLDRQGSADINNPPDGHS